MSATSLDLSQIKTDALSAAASFRTLIGLGTLATQSPTGTPSASTFLRGDFSWQTIDLSGYQPLDSDLTAIAALATTSFGRGLLTETSASTARTTLGLGTLATQSGTFSGTSSGTNTGDQDLSSLLVKASNLSDVTNAATARTNLGLGSGNTPTFLGASLTGGTVTASAPLIDATQTWNSAATTFTGILANVTDTASSSSSLLMDLQVGGVSQARFDKRGTLSFNSTASGTEPSRPGVGNWYNTLGLYGTGGTLAATVSASAIDFSVEFYFEGGSGPRLRRDANHVLAQRNGINAQTFRIYESFTDASNYTRGKLEWSSNVLRIGTEKAGTGSARALELQTDGTTRLTIGTDGSTVFAGSSSQFGNSTTACVISSNAGLARIDFLVGGSYVGNINSSSNTLRLRAPSGVAVRNNNDTADADITAAALTLSGNLTISTKNIVTDTTTGTKIGTANTQKLAFWNATPVVQPTAVADATDAASVITQLNALLSRMRDLGLIAT
jgi:hypothetical protein